MNHIRRIILIAALFLLGVTVLGQRFITLNSLTPNTLCQGSSTIVNFRVVGNYSWWNVFTVELSNSVGNFNFGTTVIGSLSESNAGTFNITTDPINVIGTGYIIRVVSSSHSEISGLRSIKIYPYPGPNPIIKIY